MGPLVLLALLMAACEERSAPSAESSEASQGGTLTIAIQSDGRTLDPRDATDAASRRLIENVYSTLMRYSEDFPNVEPGIVEEYEVSDDFRTFDFTLKEGVTFHSGRPLTAEDVRYSLNRLKEAGASEPLMHLSSIDVQNERALTLHFDTPMSPLLTYLANPQYGIVDREVVEANDGDITQVDAGSGPFKLVRWQRNQQFVLERFADYHEPDLPRLDRVIYQPIPDRTARTVALINGQVDIVLDVPLSAAERVKNASGVTAESVPGTFWEYIGMNTQRAPFDDARVRQAVAWGIDREALNQSAKFGRATVLADGPIPPHHWAHAELDLYPQRDVERARELLAEAGHDGGVSATLIVGSDFPYQVQAAGTVKDMLSDVGIDLTVRPMESAEFFGRLNDRDFQMTVVGWVGLVDPDEYFAPIYRSDGAFNQQQYQSEEVDQLIDEGRAVGEQSARAAIYERLQRHLAQDAPTVFLYVTDQISAYGDHVHGFDVHPTATTISLRRAWVER